MNKEDAGKVSVEVEKITSIIDSILNKENNGDDTLHAAVAVTHVMRQTAAHMIARMNDLETVDELGGMFVSILSTTFKAGSKMAETGSPYSSLVPCHCLDLEDAEIANFFETNRQN